MEKKNTRLSYLLAQPSSVTGSLVFMIVSKNSDSFFQGKTPCLLGLRNIDRVCQQGFNNVFSLLTSLFFSGRLELMFCFFLSKPLW